MWSFLTGSSHVPESFQGLSRLSHVPVLLSFLFMNNISLYEYATLYLFTHKFVASCVVSILAIMNNTAMNAHVSVLCGYIFSFLLDRCLGAELLGHMVTPYLWETAKFFQSDCIISHSHLPFMNIPFSPYPCQYLLFSVLFFRAILVGVK